MSWNACRRPPPLEHTILCSAVLSVKAGAKKAAEESRRESELRIDVSPGVLGIHEEHLSYAIYEVVRNACKFSKPGSTITVKGIRMEPRYHINIEDQGPGLSEEQRAGIGAFIQFNRSSQEQQGLGLGLAIARMTAQIAGGKLELSPCEGAKGLRVCFDLPLAKA